MSLALAAMVATTARAASVNYASAGIVSSTTGELTSPGYTGVTNNFSSGTNGYNFVYAAGSVGGNPGGGGSNCGSTATCATSQYGSGNSGVGMWAIPTNTTVLGANGAFLALDSDFNTTNGNTGVAVSETLTGLTQNLFYTVSFNAADAQQNTYTGASEDQVKVCLGTACATTPMVDDNSASDTNWVFYTFTFQATSSTEDLSFLGIGGTNPASNSNVPAFALVDDLSVTQTTPSPTPEPSSLMLLGTGLAGLSGLVRSRFKKTAKA
jgi:hypothetical protein